jgi:DNA polymerase-3 subunit epsilon
VVLDALAQKSGMMHGRIMPDGSYRPATGSPCSSGSSRIDVKAIIPTKDIFDEGHPFFGRAFAFTGTLQSMTRRKAMQSVVDIGGQIGNGVTKETNFLVIGEQDFRKFAHGQTKSSKLSKAETLKQVGCDIELLSERDYLEMLGRRIK